jgi:hypothetical protein
VQICRQRGRGACDGSCAADPPAAASAATSHAAPDAHVRLRPRAPCPAMRTHPPRRSTPATRLRVCTRCSVALIDCRPAVLEPSSLSRSRPSPHRAARLPPPAAPPRTGALSCRTPPARGHQSGGGSSSSDGESSDASSASSDESLQDSEDDEEAHTAAHRCIPFRKVSVVAIYT